MKNSRKIALLCVILVISMLPLLQFFAYDYPHAKNYIWQLLRGDAIIHIDVAKDRFEIISKIVTGLTSLQLSHVIIAIISAVAFWICLALMAIILYKSKVRRQNLQNN